MLAYYCCAVLVVKLMSSSFSGSESSEFVEIIIKISGGLSVIPINVMVTTSDGSATGKDTVTTNTSCIDHWLYYTVIGSGEDFDSNSINVTFAAREDSKTVNVSVTCDKIVEGEETFDIGLTLTSNNPQVRMGRATSEGRIRDSTGKWWDYITILSIGNDK